MSDPQARARRALRRVLLLVGLLVLLGALPAGASAATIPGQYIVVLKPGAREASAEASAKANGASILHRYSHALNGYAASMSDAAVSKVRTDPRVLYVSPDQTLQVATACSAQSQCVPGQVLRTQADQSSTRSGDGQGSVGTNVAVIDTGIDPTHPDLNVVGGVDCGQGKGFDDVESHGTMVAGIIAARDNAIGVVGIAPGARLWAVRAFDKHGHGANSNVICGLDWVTATRSDGDPTNDIAVANMSFIGKGSDDANCGNPPKNDPFHRAICASTAAGVTDVAAAGNDTRDFQAFTPATYSEVLTATAMADSDGQPGGLGPATFCLGEADDTPAFFSNFATLASDQAHTVAAPGDCLGTTYPGGLYNLGTGTSFASPVVAGTVALCIASGPCAGLTPAQIRQKIVADAAAYNTANPGYGFSGDPLHSPDPNRYYGYLIDAGLY